MGCHSRRGTLGTDIDPKRRDDSRRDDKHLEHYLDEMRESIYIYNETNIKCESLNSNAYLHEEEFFCFIKINLSIDK